MSRVGSCLYACLEDGGDLVSCQRSCITCLPPVLVEHSLQETDPRLYTHYFVEQQNLFGQSYLEIQHDMIYRDRDHQGYEARIRGLTRAFAAQHRLDPAAVVLEPAA